MRFARPLLVASALALLISACSTPADLAAPALTPQFGTTDEDVGVDVVISPTGQVYALADQARVDMYDDNSLEKVVLRRYDNNGTLAWAREFASYECSSGLDYCDTDNIRARAVATDARGNSYALVSRTSVALDCAGVTSTFVYKHDASGRAVGARIDLGKNGESFGNNSGPAFRDAFGMAVDGDGNLYVARQRADFYGDFCEAVRADVVEKYTPTGTLVWRRGSAVGTPQAVAVATSGSVFVTGTTGVAKYTNSGSLSWTKSGAAQDLVVVGTTTVYARNRTTVRKLDNSGRQLWSKPQSGLSGMVVGDMRADANGNVYLAGKYSASSSNRNIFTRKLNSSGKVLWTKTFGTSAYDDARGVATVTGSGIYITGATQGPLAHPYKGGENDGYVAKLGSTGSLLWKR